MAHLQPQHEGLCNTELTFSQVDHEPSPRQDTQTTHNFSPDFLPSVPMYHNVVKVYVGHDSEIPRKQAIYHMLDVAPALVVVLAFAY